MNTTTTPDMQDVIRAELDILRKEADAAVQAHFAAKTIREMIVSDNGLHRQLNASRYFWATTLYGLQCVYFLSLRRFFDPHKRSHSFDKLIALCEDHITVFSKASLAKRRKGDFKSRDELKAYVQNAFVPQKGYFEQFRLKVAQELDDLKFRDVYRKIADKIIAHNEVVQKPKIDDMFADTDIVEVEAILLLMQRIATGFWSLWTNGHELDLTTTQFPLYQLVVDDTRRALAGMKRSA